MSWDSEERIQYFKDLDRILKGEINPETKEEIKYHPWKALKDVPKKDKSKFRRFTRVIPRDEWGAIPPAEDLQPLGLPVHKIHYSFHRNWPTCYTMDECLPTVQKMQLREMNERGLPDVRHNFMIGNDCNVYEGRGMNYWAEMPYDVDPKLWDEKSLDIGFFGEDDESWPWEEMFYVASELISSWKQNNLVTENYLRM